MAVKTKPGFGSKFAFSIVLGKDEDFIDYMNYDLELNPIQETLKSIVNPTIIAQPIESSIQIDQFMVISSNQLASQDLHQASFNDQHL